MKKVVVVAIIAAVHCLAVGGILLIQGCGTPVPNLPPPEPPTMPIPPSQPVVERAVLSSVPAAPETRIWEVGETTSYAVRKGDVLSKIASHYGVSVNEIIALNGLKNPNRLVVGQKLLLPGRHDVSAPPRAVKGSNKVSSTAKVPLAGGEYVVKSGDSLSVIAARVGSTVAKIKQANGLKSDLIMVGQKLKIPAGASKSPSDPLKVPAPEVSDDVPSPTPMKDDPKGTAPKVPDMKGAGNTLVPSPTAASQETHIVKADEDVYSVAIWWGVSPEALTKLNGLAGPELTVGQELKIPVQPE